MAKSEFTLNNFKREVLGKSGLSRTNRFEVSINNPPGLAGINGTSRLASLYVEQASIPQLNINTKSFRIFGPSYQRPISSDYGGDGLPITFHVDQSMSIRKFFEDWMHQIVNPKTFTVGYQTDYATTINIRQLSDKNEIVHDVQLLQAFPRSMNIMELNNAASNQTHRLTVLFAYRNWVDVNKNITTPMDTVSVAAKQTIPVRTSAAPSFPLPPKP